MFDCEGIHTCRRKTDDFRQSKNICYTLNLLTGCDSNRLDTTNTNCWKKNEPFAIVCSRDSLFPRFPYGPLILAWANELESQSSYRTCVKKETNALAPCPTKEPWTMAAPFDASPKATSFTIVFSSTTVPHWTQKPLPAAWSYSMTVPPQSVHTGWDELWIRSERSVQSMCSDHSKILELRLDQSRLFSIDISLGRLVVLTTNNRKTIKIGEKERADNLGH